VNGLWSTIAPPLPAGWRFTVPRYRVRIVCRTSMQWRKRSASAGLTLLSSACPTDAWRNGYRLVPPKVIGPNSTANAVPPWNHEDSWPIAEGMLCPHSDFLFYSNTTVAIY
jgi:hypothetical protein